MQNQSEETGIPVISIGSDNVFHRLGLWRGHLTTAGFEPAQENCYSYSVCHDKGDILLAVQIWHGALGSFPPDIILATDGDYGAGLLAASDFLIRAFEAKLSRNPDATVVFEGETLALWKIEFRFHDKVITEIYAHLGQDDAAMLRKIIRHRNEAVTAQMQSLLGRSTTSMEKRIRISDP